MMLYDAICMTCHTKKNTQYLDQLKSIDRRLCSVEVSEESKQAAGRGYAFLWGINSRCPYGKPCPDIDRHKEEANRLAQNLEERLIAVATGDNKGLYHETLHYLQGYFPAVYRVMERIHATTKRGQEK